MYCNNSGLTDYKNIKCDYFKSGKEYTLGGYIDEGTSSVEIIQSYLVNENIISLSGTIEIEWQCTLKYCAREEEFCNTCGSLLFALRVNDTFSIRLDLEPFDQFRC